MKISLVILCSFIMTFAKSQTSINSSINEAGLNLYLELVKQSPEANAFISPYSISNALAMCYVGAEAKTATQMHTTLGFNKKKEINNKYFKNTNSQILTSDSINELRIANAFWYERDYMIASPFKKQLLNNFKSEPYPVSFKTKKHRKKTAKAINKWTAKNTNKHIKNILSEDALDEQSKLVLSNAIYFNGIWKNPFNKARTRNGIFTNDLGEKQEAEFMNSNTTVLFFEEEDVKIVEIPYAKNTFSFIALLPQLGNSLNTLEESLSAKYLEQLLQNQHKQKVTVSIPKFNSEYASDLRSLYEDMGMSNPFSNQADFTGINKSNELKIDQIYHKAFFSINEEGSEAAAATAVVIGTKSVMLNRKEFIANKPFMYLIKDNASGTILFIGRKVNF